MDSTTTNYAFHGTPAVVQALQQWEVSVLDRLLSQGAVGEAGPQRKQGKFRSKAGKGGAR